MGWDGNSRRLTGCQVNELPPPGFSAACPGLQAGPVLSPARLTSRIPFQRGTAALPLLGDRLGACRGCGGSSRSRPRWVWDEPGEIGMSRGETPARGDGKGWDGKSGSSPGWSWPLALLGSPKVPRRGDIAPVPAPTPGAAGTLFSKEPGGVPGAAGASRGKGILAVSLLCIRAPLPPFPRAVLEQGEALQRWENNPQLNRKKVWIIPGSTSSWTSSKFQQQEGRDPRGSHPSPCAPCPLQGGETEAQRSRGRLCHGRNAALPTFSPSWDEQEPEQLLWMGFFPCGMGPSPPLPFPAPAKHRGLWDFPEEFLGLFFPGWSKSMD